MALPVVAASTTNNAASTTSLSLTKPGGVVAGDLLIIIAGSESSGANGFNTPPDGWSDIAYAAAGGGASCGAFWRIATGSEGASENVVQAAATDSWGYYLRVTGADPAAPIHQVGTDYSSGLSTPATHPVTGVTTTVDDCLAFVALGFGAGDFSSFNYSGTGWTKQAETSAGGTANDNAAGTWGTKDQTTAGATGTCTISAAVDDSAAGFQFAVLGFVPRVVPRRASHPQRGVHPSQLLGGTARSGVSPDDFVPRIVPPRKSNPQGSGHPSLGVGRTQRRSGVPEDFVPPPPSGQGPRGVRTPPPPGLFRGRAARREGVSEDIAPPRARGPRTVKQRPPQPQVLRGRARRTGPRLRLELFLREIALVADLDVSALRGYRVIARNVETGAETVLGFLPAGSTTLSGVAIADGIYMLRVEADGAYWRKARFAREWPVTIVGGEIEQPLPEVRNLAYSIVGDTVYLSWAWELQEGTATPTTFGVWTGGSEPVSTAGAPAQTIAAFTPGGYTTTLAAPASTLYVAVAARLGSDVGPVATIAITAVEDIDSPSGQSARIPDGDWAPGETTP